MAKPKLTATLPDGTKATRRTEAAYTHVVAVQCDYAKDYAREAYSLDQLKSRIEGAQARIAAGEGDRQDELTVRWGAEKSPVAEAEKKLAKLPTEGLYWAATSWHSRYDLAAKQRDVAYGWSHNGVIAGTAQICEVDPS